jgi:serine/threonine protein kinase
VITPAGEHICHEPLLPPGDGHNPPLTESIKLAGRFRLEELVAESAYGWVWRAFDEELLRPVTVKVPRQCRYRPEDDEALSTEARRVAPLKHPGIVPLYDIGRHDGAYFIVSEFVDGRNWGECLRAKAVPVREAVRVMVQVARHLHFAHRQGFVHGNVKPDNILLDKVGRVYLTDFGIVVGESEAAFEAEALAYMAPEQLSLDAARADARVDVYALGVVLFEALTGRHPFPPADPAILRHIILNTESPSPRAINPAIPAALDRVCQRCLAKNPADRYPTAQALAADLSGWLNWGWVARLTGWAFPPRRRSGGRSRGTESSGPSRSFGRSVILPQNPTPASAENEMSAAGARPASEEAARTPSTSPPSRRWEILLAFGGLFGASVLTLLCLAFRHPNDQNPPPDNSITQTGPEVRLFNGHDLTGWGFHTKGKRPRIDEAVRVQAGVLLLRHQKYSRLCTTEKYRDFTLRLEYRRQPGGVNSKAGGSVLLRVANPEKMARFHLHVKLGGTEAGTIVLAGQGSPDTAEDQPAMAGGTDGRWNELEVRCRGPRVEASVNGRPTATVDKAPQAEGLVGLTSQGSDIEFRNIVLSPEGA